MKWHWFSFIGLVAGTMNSAFAQQINCGPPPQLDQRLQNDESIKGNLQGKAQFLSKLVGSADLGGQIETTKKELYVQSKDYYPAQQEAYLSYLFCAIISADTKLSTLEKLDALAKIRTPRPNANDVPANRCIDHAAEFPETTQTRVTAFAAHPMDPPRQTNWTHPTTDRWVESSLGVANVFSTTKRIHNGLCDGTVVTAVDRANVQLLISDKNCLSKGLYVRILPSCVWSGMPQMENVR
jgi:hypothetical protein